MTGDTLNGIKVVELATMVAGPYCSKMLADMAVSEPESFNNLVSVAREQVEG